MKASRISVFCMVMLAVLVAACCCGCKKKSVSPDDRLNGSWRTSKGKTHKILTFKANGSWVLQFRMEGRLAKIVEKKGKASGKWDVKDNVLYLFVEETVPDLDWGEETPVALEIVDITALNLSMKNPAGRVVDWVRVKSIKKASDGSQLATVTLDPIIVNLSRENNWGKERYLCIQIEFVLNEGKTGTSPPQMHPKVREPPSFFSVPSHTVKSTPCRRSKT